MTQSHFTVDRTGPNSLRVTMAGALDSVAMEAALQTLTLEMEGMAHGDLLMIDQGAEWPSIGAIGVELRHWPQMITVLHQIDRAAFVSDNQLFRAAATIESALLPGLEIKNFDDELSAAAWLAEKRSD
ncbi:STAS/SEC14 domain-containing protein [Gymnodinialimonas sp. 57CJ19]|uniref:STAS/SEC14 domain-containing protein n=1 Tax=Gymnodinialimonas sp. 57CJ19 TaxID=3138498 RepID=UPI00313424A5